MGNKIDNHLGKSFILPIFLFFIFISLSSSVSAWCLFGIGTTCGGSLNPTTAMLSQNLVTSLTFERPFYLINSYDLWNSAGTANYFHIRNARINDPLVNLAGGIDDNPLDYNQIGLSGNGFDFGYANVNMTLNQLPYDLNQSFSFVIDAKHLDYSAYEPLLMSENAYNAGNNWFTYYIYFGKPSISIKVGGNRIMLSSKSAVINNASWTQLGFTYDGTKKASGFKLFMNGVQLQTITTVDNLSSSDSLDPQAMHPYYIGRGLSAYQYGDYVADNILLYTYVLPPNYFKVLWANGSGYSSPPAQTSYFVGSGRASGTYDMGGATTILNNVNNPNNLSSYIEGYNFTLDKFYNNYQSVHLDYVDPIDPANMFLNLKTTKGYNQANYDDTGSLRIGLTSTADPGQSITMNFSTNAITYYDSAYLTIYNPFNYIQDSFNINITAVPLAPTTIKSFNRTYNLDNYDNYSNRFNGTNILTFDLNDYFTNPMAVNGRLRPYDNVNVSIGNTTINILVNATSYGTCDASQRIAICYYERYTSSFNNTIFLFFFGNGYTQAYKVNVSAGNNYGSVSQVFGLTSAGAIYKGYSSSGSTDINDFLSLSGLSRMFLSLFPDSSQLGTFAKYAYVILTLLIIVVACVLLIPSEAGIILASILGIASFIFYVLIGYVSIVVVAILIIIGLATLTIKSRPNRSNNG